MGQSLGPVLRILRGVATPGTAPARVRSAGAEHTAATTTVVAAIVGAYIGEVRRTEGVPSPTLGQYEIAALADEAVDKLAQMLADRIFESEVAALTPALARLHALAHLQQAVERRAGLEAQAAVVAGAGYPQLGGAWGISRQGARRRWPGLVFATRPIPTPMIRRSPVHALVPARPYNVLLIEDDAADAMLVEEALVERGMTRSVNRVEDGVAALEYLRDTDNARPDLIVLDLNMPRMSGRELLAILKDDADLSAIPVVVLTTSGAPDDIHSAYSQHANAYVTKPVNLDDFIASVHSIDAFFLDTAQPLPVDGD
jgi:CheY-like chemotaxis protein